MEEEKAVSVIETVSHQLGVLSGRFDSIEESMRTISSAMETIAGHSVKVDLLEQARIKTEERLTDLECEQAKMQQALAQAEGKIDGHIDKDVPIEAKLGKWAISFIIFVGGLVMKWLFDTLPKLLKLLE